MSPLVGYAHGRVKIVIAFGKTTVVLNYEGCCMRCAKMGRTLLHQKANNALMDTVWLAE